MEGLAECQTAADRANPLATCPNCRVGFYRLRSKYCSRRCYRIHNDKSYKRHGSEGARIQAVARKERAQRRTRMFPDALALRCMLAYPDKPEAQALRDRLLPVVIPSVEPKPSPRPRKSKRLLAAPPVIVLAPRRSKVSIRLIQAEVGRAFGITANDITSQRRSDAEVTPRRIAMFLARQLTQLSYAEIGRRFGDRDHTTVLSAVAKARTRYSRDPEYKALVDGFREELESQVEA